MSLQLKLLNPKIQQLMTVRDQNFHNIKGKFHAHITLLLKPEQVEQLQKFARQNKASTTVIELFDNENTHQQYDVMLTKYYWDNSGQAVVNCIDNLYHISMQLHQFDYDVLRVKLEHESLPTLVNYNRQVYRETHVKLRIGRSEYEGKMEFLRRYGKQFGYVPSRNPREMKEDYVHHFLNTRHYDCDFYESSRRTDELLEFLANSGFTVVETKRETSVFDTNLDLDKWWA